MKTQCILALTALIAIVSPAAAAEGDAAKGAKVYLKCKACHENEKGVSKIGPTLKGIVGRPVGGIADYKYSDPMKAKGAEGTVWDEATLTIYLPDPKGFVKGTKMAFAGLKKPEEVADIIAYLKAHP